MSSVSGSGSNEPTKNLADQLKEKLIDLDRDGTLQILATITALVVAILALSHGGFLGTLLGIGMTGVSAYFMFTASELHQKRQKLKLENGISESSAIQYKYGLAQIDAHYNRMIQDVKANLKRIAVQMLRKECTQETEMK